MPNCEKYSIATLIKHKYCIKHEKIINWLKAIDISNINSTKVKDKSIDRVCTKKIQSSNMLKDDNNGCKLVDVENTTLCLTKESLMKSETEAECPGFPRNSGSLTSTMLVSIHNQEIKTIIKTRHYRKTLSDINSKIDSSENNTKPKNYLKTKQKTIQLIQQKFTICLSKAMSVTKKDGNDHNSRPPFWKFSKKIKIARNDFLRNEHKT